MGTEQQDQQRMAQANAAARRLEGLMSPDERAALQERRDALEDATLALNASQIDQARRQHELQSLSTSLLRKYRDQLKQQDGKKETPNG